MSFLNKVVVLMKSTVLGFNNFESSVVDRIYEFLGNDISLQLVSAVHSDPAGAGNFYHYFHLFLRVYHTRYTILV